MCTEKYRDAELTSAKANENKIKQAAKKTASEGHLTPAAEKALLEKMRSEGLTDRERQVIDSGISNLECHYPGSAKILGRIGQGFAEAMADLEKLR